MPRRKRNKPNENVFYLLLAVLIGYMLLGSLESDDVRNAGLGLVGLCIIAVCIAGAVWLYSSVTARRRNARLAALRAHRVDIMTGTEFEYFLQHLLIARGFTNVKRLGGSGDSGIDITAAKDGRTYAIQAKRYKNKVPKSAMYEAVSGRLHRQCDYAMVITNSYFSKQGLQYARETNCMLVDRDDLSRWVFELQGGV